MNTTINIRVNPKTWARNKDEALKTIIAYITKELQTIGCWQKAEINIEEYEKAKK